MRVSDPAVRPARSRIWQPWRVAQTTSNGFQRATSATVCPAGECLPSRMAAADTAGHELEFRRRVCNLAACRAVFFICRHCDRGHRYCRSSCRLQARHQQLRDANRRHQQSEEGRLDHLDRQHQYLCRRRCANSHQQELSPVQADAPQPPPHEQAVSARLTDQGSLAIPWSGKIQRWDETTPVRCRFCGRAGRFVNPYPRHSWIERLRQGSRA